MSRLQKSAKNMAFGIAANSVTSLLGFVSRTVFVYTLGVTYLGINGLFTNILSLLSFAELGIGEAMTFAFYRPVAEGDTEKIKSLMRVYKRAYYFVALVIAICGLAFLPFLHLVVKDPGDVGNISVYYLIFLLNTVSSYFVTYKYSLIVAEQKNYLFISIDAITRVVIVVAQVAVLLIFKNFLGYLLIALVISLTQKVFMSAYLNRLHPELTDKNVQKLPKEELEPLKKNIYGLAVQRLSHMAVNNTDSIIISAFLGVVKVGIVSNYNLVIYAVSQFTNLIFGATTAGFGNLFITAPPPKRLEAFHNLNFLSFWVHGFSAVAFFILLTPFVTMWMRNPKLLIDSFTVLLLSANFFFAGQDSSLNVVRTGGGIFYKDRYISVVITVVNLVTSILLVMVMGLPGVFLGTVIQYVVALILKPIIPYRQVFETSATRYYVTTLIYMAATVGAGALCYWIKLSFFSGGGLLNFLCLCVTVVVVVNVIFFCLFCRTKEFAYYKNIATAILQKIFHRKKEM